MVPFIQPRRQSVERPLVCYKVIIALRLVQAILEQNSSHLQWILYAYTAVVNQGTTSSQQQFGTTSRCLGSYNLQLTEGVDQLSSFPKTFIGPSRITPLPPSPAYSYAMDRKDIARVTGSHIVERIGLEVRSHGGFGANVQKFEETENVLKPKANGETPHLVSHGRSHCNCLRNVKSFRTNQEI
ncbi:hypothetical protein CPB86DRAFT_815197 [Serendipita vermifera]|nr:hypothetical protein CPB86DRAFT_815197 [Serendipita vermifera]